MNEPETNESDPAYKVTPSGAAAFELMRQLEAWQSAGLAPAYDVTLAIQKLIDARIAALSASVPSEQK